MGIQLEQLNILRGIEMAQRIISMPLPRYRACEGKHWLNVSCLCGLNEVIHLFGKFVWVVLRYHLDDSLHVSFAFERIQEASEKGKHAAPRL